jgi:hypothetical protein
VEGLTAVVSPAVAEIPNGVANPIFIGVRPVLVPAVLKFHATRQPTGTPVALVTLVVIIAVYEVLGNRADGVVKVATCVEAS